MRCGCYSLPERRISAASRSSEGESDDVREAAAVLAELTPEQLDALRDLDDRRLAALVVEAVRPAPVFEAVL